MQIETEQHPYGEGDASYRAAGGFEGLLGLVERFYRKMDELPEAARIRAMHPDDLTVSKDKLARFLSGWLGGPRLYDGSQLTADGYVNNFGNSWVMAMQFTDDGPVARAVMVYSQSEDPDSPHFADQTLLQETNDLRDVLYTTAAIDADPALVELQLVLD